MIYFEKIVDSLSLSVYTEAEKSTFVSESKKGAL